MCVQGEHATCHSGRGVVQRESPKILRPLLILKHDDRVTPDDMN